MKTAEQIERRANYLRAKIARAQKELNTIKPIAVAPQSQPVTPDKFKDVNLLIACPAYGGMVQHIFVSSLIALSQTLVNFGIGHQIKFLGNQSLIPFARDHFANAVLFEADSRGRPFSHLLFLDVDQGFQATDIVKMIQADKDIIGLPVSTKRIFWSQVADAVRKGVPTEHLPYVAGRPNFHDIPGTRYSRDEPSLVRRVGTAIMLIKKDVLEKMRNAHPEWEARCAPDDISDPRTPYFHFFQIGIDRESKHMLSEDWFFCDEARRLGFGVWLLPSAITALVGTNNFMMSMPALALLREECPLELGLR